MFGSQGILNKQLNAISKEKPNFWTMKQEKGTLIQYSTVNSQICLITGSWSNLVNEKPSITILFFAKPAPGIFGWFYCLGRGISERHRSSLDPGATWPCSSNAAPEPQRLAHSSSCLCTKPPAPESRVNTAALVFGHRSVTTPRSAHSRHRPGCAPQSVPALPAENYWHPGGWGCSCSTSALDLLQRDKQEATFILGRAMSSPEGRTQHTELH